MSERYLPGPPASSREGTLFLMIAVVIAALAASASLTILGIPFRITSMVIAVAISGFGVFACYLVWVLWTASRFYADTDRALIALSRGELEHAAEVWSRWQARRGPELVRAMAGHNLGWTAIRQGEIRRAIEILGANDRVRRRGLTSAHLAATTAQDLALCYALAGDLEAARAWFDESERRVTARSPKSVGAMRALVRAVIDCRAGRVKDAASALEDGWEHFETAAPRDLLRPLRVVRAFATSSSPREQGKALKPAYPREFGFLGVEWPEMVAFLAKHHLHA